jgi:hypothetical protein
MKIKLHKNSCCIECGASIDIDLGTMGSYFEPPEPPQIACTKCDWSPDLADIDWEDYDKPEIAAVEGGS